MKKDARRLAAHARAYVTGHDQAARRFPLAEEDAAHWTSLRKILLGLADAADPQEGGAFDKPRAVFVKAPRVHKPSALR